MPNRYFAELTDEELAVIRELEQALSHIKDRQISLVAYDLGDVEAYEYDLDEDDASYGAEDYDKASVLSPKESPPSSP